MHQPSPRGVGAADVPAAAGDHRVVVAVVPVNPVAGADGGVAAVDPAAVDRKQPERRPSSDLRLLDGFGLVYW